MHSASAMGSPYSFTSDAWARSRRGGRCSQSWPLALAHELHQAAVKQRAREIERAAAEIAQ